MAPSKIGLHPSIVVNKTHGNPPAKKYSVIDIFTSTRKFLVFNPSIDNLSRALNERLFHVKLNGVFDEPTHPKDKSWDKLATIIYPLLVDSLHKFTPYTREEIPGLYVGRKNTIYNAALVSLRSKPLTVKDSTINCFGKIENLDATTKKIEDIVQRVIQARGPRYNLELGRYLKKIEHQVYRDIDKMFAKETGRSKNVKTVIKGMNASETARHMAAKWFSFKDPVCISIDAKRFDQHTSVDALLFEHKIYPMYFSQSRHKKSLRYLLSQQILNKGRAFCKDGKLKYTHLGGRCSGDMNTGLGNSVLMTSMVFGYMRSIGISDYSLFCNGDDAGIIVERKHLKEVQANMYEYFKDLGFILEIEEPVDIFEQISFCQTNPVFDGYNWRMIRDIRVSSSKDALSITAFQSAKDWVYYMDSVGQGGLSMTAGIPMCQEYYSAMIRNSKINCPSGFDVSKRKAQMMDRQTGFWFMSNNMNLKYQPVTVEARVSFYKAFGILPDVQIQMEQEYKDTNLQWCGAVTDDAIIRTEFC